MDGESRLPQRQQALSIATVTPQVHLPIWTPEVQLPMLSAVPSQGLRAAGASHLQGACSQAAAVHGPMRLPLSRAPAQPARPPSPPRAAPTTHLWIGAGQAQQRLRSWCGASPWTLLR